MKTVYEFEIHGGLRIPVSYCFDCEKWHAINEVCSLDEEEIEVEDDTSEVIE